MNQIVLMGVVNRRRRLETHCEVGIFRITLGIQVESVYISVCSLLNIDITDSLMMEQVVCPMILLFCKRLLLTSKKEHLYK